MLATPLLILAPPGAHAARLAAMLGQHPAAQDLPELNLFLAPTLAGLSDISALADGRTAEGLLRAVAAVHFGAQRDATIVEARRWLARRPDWTGAMTLDDFARRLAPNLLVAADTSVAWRPDMLDRLLETVPDVRVLHLTEHPRSWCRDTAAALHDRLFIAPDYKDYEANPPALDPQVAWFRVHGNIARAMSGSSPSEYRLQRVEALLARPEATLASLCDWLGLSSGAAEIDAMQQPERSIFAGFGPNGAVHGADEGWLRDPAFARRLASGERLEGPLEWRRDGKVFAPELIALANMHGYH